MLWFIGESCQPPLIARKRIANIQKAVPNFFHKGSILSDILRSIIFEAKKIEISIMTVKMLNDTSLGDEELDASASCVEFIARSSAL